MTGAFRNRGQQPPAAIVVERSVPAAGQHALLSVQGPLGFGTTGSLRDAAAELIATGQPWLLIDLTATSRLDAAGLATLVAIRRRASAAGGCLHLLDSSGTTTQALRRAGLSRLLPVEHSIAAAMTRDRG